MTKKEYLNDGVSVRHDGFHVVLSAGENEIFLDGSTLDAFFQYLERFGYQVKKVKKEEN